MISPKYQKLEFKKVERASKAHLLMLEHELKRSKIAIDSNSFKKSEQNLKENIISLQTELHDSVCSINIETKKTKVLQELIGIISAEMLKYQSTTKKEDEEEVIKKNKQTIKLKSEYDLILHKNNEEIAKILKLQDLANGRRSERVVYSNLFKKLEKELKHYEEIYKESLMVSEISTRKYYDWLRIKSGNLTEVEEKRSNIEAIVKKNYEARYSSLKGNSEKESGWKGFAMENQNNTGGSRLLPLSTKKGNVKSFFESDERLEPKTPGAKLIHTKEVLKKMDYLERTLERIHTYCEFTKTSEVSAHYGGIKEKNILIANHIEQINDQIFHEAKALQELTKEIACFQPETTKFYYQTTEYNDSPQIVSNHTEDCLSKIKEISLLFGITTNNSFNIESSFREIDEKISELAILMDCSFPFMRPREDTTLSEAAVEGIIEKMERFHSCEKILDEEFFKQEYYKEIAKRKMGKIKKEIK